MAAAGLDLQHSDLTNDPSKLSKLKDKLTKSFKTNPHAQTLQRGALTGNHQQHRIHEHELRGHKETEPDFPDALKHVEIVKHEKMDVFERRFAAKPDMTHKCGIDDFEIIRGLGRGAFGLVVLVTHKRSQKVAALKTMMKAQIVKAHLVENTINEKRILQACDWPVLMAIHYTFKDKLRLYLALEFVTGGELFGHLREAKRFSEARARFYAACTVLAFDYLHSLHILYRDLKPENMLLCSNGYIKICDFGFAKRVFDRTYTMCGTPEYIAPEIILNKPYGKTVDWWSFGVLCYEFNAGFPPFNPNPKVPDAHRRFERMYEQICEEKVRYPPSFSRELRDLLRHLLERDRTRRYGNLRNGTRDIMLHSWFRTIDWMALYEQKFPPPFVPDLPPSDVMGPGDPRRAAKFKDGIDELKKSPKEPGAPLYEDVFIDF